MSYGYGGQLIAGAHAYGGPGLGVLAELVAADGLDGPGYVYGALNMPADTGKEISAVITRWPTLGTLTVNSDFSFSYDGTDDYALYALKVDGVPSVVDIGYGAGVGRFDLVFGISVLGGAITIDNLVASGGFASGYSVLGGDITLNNILCEGVVSGYTPNSASPGNRRVQETQRAPRMQESGR
jgi:hypothetical protein